MRLKCLLAVAAAIVAVGTIAPQPVEANGWRGEPTRKRVSCVRGAHACAYYPKYRYVHWYRPDPYGYHYVPRRYYPYYNSAYWRPLPELRYRYRYDYELPEYYPAWGSPTPWYRPRGWHGDQRWFHHGWYW